MLAFSMKMIDGAGIKKSFLTQYLRRGRPKKVIFAENDSRDMYVGIFFNSICFARFALESSIQGKC